jgi:uncharacterized protein YrrD
MRFKDFKGRSVVTLDNAETAGQVSDLLLDLANQRVLGFRINMSGMFSGHKNLALSDIRSIGQDAVTVANAEVLKDDKDSTNIAKLPDVGDVAGSKVMGDAGNQVGTVSDIDFDTNSGQISGYVLSEGFLTRLQGIIHLVPAADVKSIGSKMIVVSDAVAEPGAASQQ